MTYKLTDQDALPSMCCPSCSALLSIYYPALTGQNVVPARAIGMYCKHVLVVCAASMYYQYGLPACTASMYCQHVLPACTASMYCQHVLLAWVATKNTVQRMMQLTTYFAIMILFHEAMTKHHSLLASKEQQA
jgi:hypothetical protein